MRIAMARVAAVDNRLRPISTGVKGQSARASGRQAGGDPVGRVVVPLIWPDASDIFLVTRPKRPLVLGGLASPMLVQA